MQRVVVVTGGGTGIGRAVARAFSLDGERVVILGRRADVLRTTAEALGGNVDWKRGDVSCREDVCQIVTAIVRERGPIDVLVNAAGFARPITTDTPLEEAEARWDEVVGTNLKGAFLMSMAVAPYLQRPGGRIIHISSVAAVMGGSRAGSAAYAAAKAGLHGLTYALARELGPQGITVNAVAPGFIAKTGFTEGWSEDRVRGILSQTPAGRAGEVEDVAAAVRYLASADASFVLGEVLHVNGGWIFGR